jgi:hypothetical protein
MLRLVTIVMLLGVTSATAQQIIDPDLLQAAAQALAAQRNRAMDEAASAEAQLLKAQRQIAALQQQLDELKKKVK